jgi:hypothetical protein
VDRACMDPWWLAMDDGRTDGCMMQGKAGRERAVMGGGCSAEPCLSPSCIILISTYTCRRAS